MMAGVRGMHSKKPRPGTGRCKMWQTMRIMRRFAVPDLCRTSGASPSNAAKFIARLAGHGYLAANGNYAGGRPGEYQAWRLVRDVGPDYPTVCSVCGRPIGERCRRGDAR
ncbi:MAG: hypothetical protein ABIL58_20105 [Pseudomonadota bacterium]